MTAKRGEEVTGRTVSYILGDPINDGGQWDMAVNLVTKHGLMPKKCFPESFSSDSSGRLNGILKSKLREYAKNLRTCCDEGMSDEELQATILKMMSEIYKIVGICPDVDRKYLSGHIHPQSLQEEASTITFH